MARAIDPVTNFASAIVSGTYNAAATSVTLAAGGGGQFPAISEGQFNLVWFNSTDYTGPEEDPQREIVRVTNRVSDVLTVLRGQEGTIATDKSLAGVTYKMMLGVTENLINEINAELELLDALIEDLGPTGFPSQTGNSGEFLTTDGTNLAWGDPSGLPTQTGNSGKFLTTDGTTPSWALALPSQTGNAGEYLTTDGTNASWSTAPSPSFANVGTGAGDVYKDTTATVNLRRIKAGTNVTVSIVGDDIVVNASGSLGTIAWGGITGTLSDQTDLQTALDAKADAAATTSALALKADKTITIGGAGLISGGGDLSANRTITTSMSTGKLVGRSTASTGIMEEITVGTGLTLAAGTLAVSGGTTPNLKIIGTVSGTAETSFQASDTTIYYSVTGTNQIRKIVSGTDSLVGTASTTSTKSGMVVNSTGDIYYSVSANPGYIEKMTSGGVTSSVYTATAGNSAQCIGIDVNDNVYAKSTDLATNVFKKITSGGTVTNITGPTGSDTVLGVRGKSSTETYVYAQATGTNAIRVYTLDNSGTCVLLTASSAITESPSGQSQFVSSSGDLYVSYSSGVWKVTYANVATKYNIGAGSLGVFPIGAVVYYRPAGDFDYCSFNTATSVVTSIAPGYMQSAFGNIALTVTKPMIISSGGILIQLLA